MNKIQNPKISRGHYTLIIPSSMSLIERMEGLAFRLKKILGKNIYRVVEHKWEPYHWEYDKHLTLIIHTSKTRELTVEFEPGNYKNFHIRNSIKDGTSHEFICDILDQEKDLCYPTFSYREIVIQVKSEGSIPTVVKSDHPGYRVNEPFGWHYIQAATKDGYTVKVTP